jgi:hypothetical protein
VSGVDTAARNVAAAHAAIGAAIGVCGPTVGLDDLISGMLAYYRATLEDRDPALAVVARDRVALHVLVDLALLVGAERLQELLNEATSTGAGARLQ